MVREPFTIGELATHFYVVEEGEVALVDSESLAVMKKMDIGKLAIVSYSLPDSYCRQIWVCWR